MDSPIPIPFLLIRGMAVSYRAAKPCRVPSCDGMAGIIQNEGKARYRMKSWVVWQGMPQLNSAEAAAYNSATGACFQTSRVI